MGPDELLDCYVDDRFGQHDDISIFIVAVSGTRRLNSGGLEKELLELLEGSLDVFIHCRKSGILSLKLEEYKQASYRK